MTRAIVIAAAMAAACGSSTSATPDAARTADAPAPDARAPDATPPPPDATTPPPDAASAAELACLDAPPPTTAADPIAITGKLFAVDHYQVDALAGVTVALRRTSDDGAIASATTGADGAFTITTPSGEHPIDGYLYLDDGVHRPTYAYAGRPLDGRTDALVIVADAAELGRWYADAGDTWSAAKRTVVAAVTDCTPRSVDGASVTTSPSPARLAYYDAAAQRWDPTLAASTNGFALLTGAGADEAITAHLGAVAWPPHAYPGHAGALTLAVVPPTQ